MKRIRNDRGFTLVESVASWTILLIAMTIFLKCIGMAHVSTERGNTLRRQCAAALERAEYGKEPLRTKKTELKFRVDKRTVTLDAVIMEYGLAESEGVDSLPVKLKILVPANE